MLPHDILHPDILSLLCKTVHILDTHLSTWSVRLLLLLLLLWILLLLLWMLLLLLLLLWILRLLLLRLLDTLVDREGEPWVPHGLRMDRDRSLPGGFLGADMLRRCLGDRGVHSELP